MNRQLNIILQLMMVTNVTSCEVVQNGWSREMEIFSG
jgi:hypothetical protein